VRQCYNVVGFAFLGHCSAFSALEVLQKCAVPLDNLLNVLRSPPDGSFSTDSSCSVMKDMWPELLECSSYKSHHSDRHVRVLD